ncbi:hypothetical protein TTHERM_00675540 (macronuclear) [Tetrahymena thermophila SB210]|uniref:Transmembrane protein n=1 Tax=Tetrahymena thermophila (strain SB210) TaxID=312017 RepID=Q23E06_TETTS|nr:hypothetical protein TTHERM_00675540 [Tetrahymena thermophila SB210]EAR94781.1 hypothetical protein TTHERM_00675540 [Tetrahymena thermophila SB210]|eukprot:XP_001015026.1 hypothetical protein TTHERM_00675540 [Tetrahymena thermophila SB210]
MNFKQIIAIAIQLLILVSASDQNCNFSVSQLNNKVLKLTQQTKCDKCFTSDVKLTIQSNSQQITSLTLTATSSSSPVKTLILQPFTKSLTLSPSFMVEIGSMTSGDYYSYNFIDQCNAKQVNGNLVYDLQFKAKVNGNMQYFELNNGTSGNSSTTKISFILFILSLYLIF